MKIDVTETQLKAIKSLADNASSSIGGCSEEANKEMEWQVKHVDNMLKRNNLKPRDFN